MTTPAYRKKMISDHAVVRYMERKYGADFDIVRTEMFTPELATSIAAGKSIHKQDGLKFRLEKGKVITVVI